ncbi:hypothetical protein HMPREF0650_1948 [Hoylesella buccalis ATCC 35310]|uniref:Uncharacterized protein n=1 Tax=Hoylesella buccalis ATCC 35310 TaxID=679190 RepID=D1W7Q1_9BACT|nr:hypothetical protein HMPREF0650_1948 [Hoylesella buccalis ATCC 35310]
MEIYDKLYLKHEPFKKIKKIIGHKVHHQYAETATAKGL